MPLIGMGKTLMTCSRASKIHFAALTFTGLFTVQPVLTSGRVHRPVSDLVLGLITVRVSAFLNA